MEALGALLELLGSISTFLFTLTKDVTEEEIEKNINFLKEYQWFQKYLDNDKFENLIMNDKDVRFAIGKLNSEKMKKNAYYKKHQIKIQKVLLEKTN